jgi:hypothetical protein
MAYVVSLSQMQVRVTAHYRMSLKGIRYMQLINVFGLYASIFLQNCGSTKKPVNVAICEIRCVSYISRIPASDYKYFTAKFASMTLKWIR